MEDKTRFNTGDVASWHTDGFAIMNDFFSPEEIQPIKADYDRIYGHHRLTQSAIPEATQDNLTTSTTTGNPLGEFNEFQFKNIHTFPYQGSPEMMMLSLHPSLIEFARKVLGVEKVQLYQSHSWAKFTGLADYAQPFHCDFGNHTLTIPSDNPAERAVDIIVYFTDVTDEHGALHYVTKPDSDRLLRPGAISAPKEADQVALKTCEKSVTCKAGCVVAHGIDTFHRGTNLTLENGYRYSMTIGYKATGNSNINYNVWQSGAGRNWDSIFALATSAQLECIGIPLPGDPYWTERTLKLTQSRWPNWDMNQYFSRSTA